jgi:hypothetical protein
MVDFAGFAMKKCGMRTRPHVKTYTTARTKMKTIFMRIINGRTVELRLNSFTHEIFEGMDSHIGYVCAFTTSGEKVDVVKKSMKNTDANRVRLDLWAKETIRNIIA